MSDPTPLPRNKDDEPEVVPQDLISKPRGKSGFDPGEYEASKKRELPPRLMMYQDVLDIAEKRFLELANMLENDEYDNLFHFYDRWKNGHSVYKEILETGVLMLDGNENRRIFSVPLSGIGNDAFKFGAVQLPKEKRVLAGPNDERLATISISIMKDGELYISDEDIHPDKNIIASSHEYSLYIIVLGPEMEPVAIQARRWDLENQTLSEKIAHYPIHRLTDDECTAILQAVATAPL